LDTGNAFTLSLSADGERLTGAYTDGTIGLWHLSGGPDAVIVGEKSRESALIMFGPKAPFLASRVPSSMAGALEVVRLPGAAIDVFNTPMSRDSGHSKLMNIRPVSVYDGFDGRRVFSIREAGYVVFSPDGERVISGSNDGTITIRDTFTGQTLMTLRDLKRVVTSIALTPNGHLLAAASEDGMVSIWDGTPVQ